MNPIVFHGYQDSKLLGIFCCRICASNEQTFHFPPTPQKGEIMVECVCGHWCTWLEFVHSIRDPINPKSMLLIVLAHHGVIPPVKALIDARKRNATEKACSNSILVKTLIALLSGYGNGRTYDR